MSIYKGTQLISGVATPIEPTRNIGQIIPSLLPITDAGLHLLDGTLISGDGIYKGFVDYIAELYNADSTANYFAQSHGEIAWVQPIATGSTTAITGGDMVITSSNSHSGYEAWKAMDGVYSGTTATTGWGTSNTTANQWWQLKLPYQIRITGLKGYQRYDTTPANANTIGRFYTSSDMTTPIGDTYTNASGINWNAVEVSGIPEEGIVTDTIYFQKTGGGSYGGLGELVITATVVGSEKTAEQIWQTSVSNYGVCGKFVYNASANTVRLPKVTGILEGTIDPSALGDLVEAGLPNITGTFTDTDNLGSATGAFNYTSKSGRGHWNSDDGQHTIDFDASRSNPIYGNSTTVQPQTIKGYYYIVVATSAKTDIEVDIDNIVTDLNQKVDISNMVEVPTIIEVSDPSLMPSWYRVWSNGWCEMGGTTAFPSTVTFLKEFKDVNYTTLFSLTSLSTEGYEPVVIYDKTTTSMKIKQLVKNYTGQADWYACGYIKQGD